MAAQWVLKHLSPFLGHFVRPLLLALRGAASSEENQTTMNWRELTEEDVMKSLAGAELEAYRRIQANEDGSDGDVLPDIMEAVVMEVRGRIAACKTNTLAEGVTLPEVVIHHTVSIVRYRLLTRLGLSVKSAREMEYKDARTFLADVSRCQVAIPDPAGSDDTQQHWPKPSFTKRRQNFNRASQDGA